MRRPDRKGREPFPERNCTHRARPNCTNSGQTMAKQGQTRIVVSTGSQRCPGCCDSEAGKGLPPVHLWNPPFCGDLDMRIAADGTWFYQGTPIGRPALVRLFSTILKREGGKHFLVTPVEKVGIQVDDAPFWQWKCGRAAGQRTAAAVSHQCRRLGARAMPRTGCDSRRPADGGLTPYLHVRADLWAKVTRALYYDLVDMGEERVVDGHSMFGSCPAASSSPWRMRSR